MVELTRQYYPGILNVPKEDNTLPKFNPECVCGHDEFSHFHDAAKPDLSVCKACKQPKVCNGFSARQRSV
jgi:hypothetical protein